MNERIKEFEKQCWDNQTNHLNAEKFAELIVKECADLCSKYGDRVEYNRPNSGYEAWECADIIKQHFGVEE